MTNALVIMTGLIISWLVADSGAVRAENFRRIAGTQNQARFSGMDLTDDVHWRDSFSRDGRLLVNPWTSGDWANGGLKAISFASNSAQNRAVATRYGLRGRAWSSGAKGLTDRA